MNPPILKTIVDLIVSEVSPYQIILFGSYAKGNHTPRSDIDLLVLKKDLEDEDRAIDKIYYSFLECDEINIPVDVIAMDYDRYLDVSDDLGYIYRSIKKEGRLIYESV